MYTRICAHIDIRVYTKYAHIYTHIRECIRAYVHVDIRVYAKYAYAKFAYI